MQLQGKVGIIVLNYNGEDCLLRCLESLQKLTYTNKTIIIVDNHSTDDSFQEAKKMFSDFGYIENPENYGFARGMNQGIKMALKEGAEAVWLFNNDALAEPESLRLLVAEASHFSLGTGALLSPLILESQTKRIWFGKGRVNFFRMRAEHMEPSARELALNSYSSDFLTGCALFITRSVIEKIGLLDERFFLYYEDADYSFRARKAGHACRVVPNARVWHREKSRFNPEKLFHLVYSGLIFFQKNTPRRFRAYLSVYVTIRRIKNALDLLLGREEARLVRRAYERFYHQS